MSKAVETWVLSSLERHSHISSASVLCSLQSELPAGLSDLQPKALLCSKASQAECAEGQR